MAVSANPFFLKGLAGNQQKMPENQQKTLHIAVTCSWDNATGCKGNLVVKQPKYGSCDMKSGACGTFMKARSTLWGVKHSLCASGNFKWLSNESLNGGPDVL